MRKTTRERLRLSTSRPTKSTIMDAHGKALLDYFKGDEDATMLLHRDDGFTYPALSVRDWFYPDGLPAIDQEAINRCQGRVLDVGASSGSHSLALQDRGCEFLALEISPHALAVLEHRDVKPNRLGDIHRMEPSDAGVFDTVLLMGNIGICGDIPDLKKLFGQFERLISSSGQIITDSVDPFNFEDAVYTKYRAKKMSLGRYPGERTLCLEYKGERSSWFEWMHIDADTLAEVASQEGFRFERLHSDGRRFLCRFERI